MKKLGKIANAYLADESGATAVEYGMILALISLWWLVAAGEFTGNTNNNFETLASTIQNGI